MSTVHAVVIVYLAATAMTSDVMDTTDVKVTSPQSSEANIIFIAYLASDLLLSVIYNTAWPGWQANMIHHVTGIWAWYMMTRHGFCHSIALCAMLTEATTPFVNQRWFFDKSGMKEGNLFVANGLLMTLLWFALRVCLFGWLGYRIFGPMRKSLLALPSLHLFCGLFSYTVGYALQLFWFSKIFKGALKVLSGPKSKAT